MTTIRAKLAYYHASDEVDIARREHGAGSPEHEAALRERELAARRLLGSMERNREEVSA